MEYTTLYLPPLWEPQSWNRSGPNTPLLIVHIFYKHKQNTAIISVNYCLLGYGALWPCNMNVFVMFPYHKSIDGDANLSTKYV
jgi:hypothetical protein